MDYTAKFEIDGGVSNGFALKSPNRYERHENFSADPREAYSQAMQLAGNFARDHLSNPVTGKTSVKLVSLVGSDRKEIPFPKESSLVEMTQAQHLLHFIFGLKSA